MKKYILLALSCSLPFLFSSCNDLLDLDPETDPSDATMWNSVTAFEKEANNYYTYLPKMQNLKTGSDTYCYGFMDREDMGDLVFNINNFNSISNSHYGVPSTDKVYEEYWKRLRSVNYLFKNAAGYSKPADIAKYVAEAHFFRAYLSYIVFVDYGPLPIIKDVLDTSSPNLYAARATRDEFANFIIEDLETAINSGVLPKQSEVASSSDNGRITIGAAQALLARMCLFEGTWQKYHNNNTARASELLTKAADNADKVMEDNSSYELFYNSTLKEKSYRYMFILESVTKTNPAGVLKAANKEYILRNRFHEQTRQSAQNNTHRGNGMLLSRKMVEMFLDKDGKNTLPDYKTSLNSFLKDRDPRLSSTVIGLGDLYWNYASGSTFNRDHADSLSMQLRVWNGEGFYANKFAGERKADANSDGFDVPIIRLAEIYLIYAEAKCELGNGTISQADLDKSINKLRERVSMPYLTSASVPSGSTMLKEIRRERTVELFLEGFRFDDLRRWATAKSELSQNVEGIWMGTGSAFAKPWVLNYTSLGKKYEYSPDAALKIETNTEGYTIHEKASNRTFEDKNYLFPLPDKQIELNVKLEQNPGWSL